jgi:hypothetical protein
MTPCRARESMTQDALFFGDRGRGLREVGRKLSLLESAYEDPVELLAFAGLDNGADSVKGDARQFGSAFDDDAVGETFDDDGVAGE